MRRIVLPAALSMVALSLFACAPKYPKCETDEHCKEHNEVCVNGSCQECGRDTDCKQGFVCRDTKCTPAPECTATTPCQPGFKCQNEKCVAGCDENSACPSGQECRAGKCAPKAQCSTDADCPSGQRCDENLQCVAGQAKAACNLDPVLFDFNEFTLTSQARATLDRDADCIKSGKMKVTVAGHADERGTEEYNLHLGEKRANAVKKYLTALGIDASSLNVVSYGEERPADPGHDEGAWARNRRVEFSER